jgi:hypothetical protein
MRGSFPEVLPQPWQELVANRLPRHDLVLGQRCDPAGRLRSHEGVAGGRQQPHAGDRDARGRAEGQRAVAAQQQRFAGR